MANPYDEKGLRQLLTIVGRKWTIATVRTLHYETLRFSAIQKLLPGITQKVLTETLRRLERDGMVERLYYRTVPPQVEYRLTPLGLALLGLSEALLDWTKEYTDSINEARETYDHRTVSRGITSNNTYQ